MNFEKSLNLCDQINCDQANYQSKVLIKVYSNLKNGLETTKTEIIEDLIKTGKSTRPILKMTRQQYFKSNCPVYKVLKTKKLVTITGNSVKATIDTTTTKAQLEELIVILEGKCY